MRNIHHAAHIVFTIALCSLALPGQTMPSVPTRTANTAGTKDPAAVAVLNQMLAATGWVTRPTDLVATATVVSGNKSTLTVQIKAINEANYRQDVTGGSAPFSFVRSGGSTKTIQGGKAREVRGEFGSQLEPYHLPFFLQLLSASNPITDVVDGGIMTFDGQPVHQLGISQHANGSSANLPKIVVLISTTTLFPVEIVYDQSPEGFPNVHATFRRTFSDYRRVGTIYFPYSQQEWLGEQKIQDMTFTSVQLNTGLTLAAIK